MTTSAGFTWACSPHGAKYHATAEPEKRHAGSCAPGVCGQTRRALCGALVYDEDLLPMFYPTRLAHNSDVCRTCARRIL